MLKEGVRVLAVALAPRSWPVHYVHGLLSLDLRDFSRAVEDFDPACVTSNIAASVTTSSARPLSEREVASTRVKHVRKPRGAAPGAVTYSQEKVVALRVEPARIERLLAEEEGAEA